jgi:hypothetical protein
MSHKTWLLWIPLVLLGFAAFFARPVAADSSSQVVYQTPTARPDGHIVYIVQEGDTCLRVQLLTGTTIDQLRTLNKLDQNCTLIPGKELLLAVITPVASPTPNPHITATPLLPTQTPIKGNGKVCVSLYTDVNGDAVREDDEPALANGAASITNRLGSVSKTVSTTSSDEPVCEEVPEGDYSISMAIPGGYNPTVAMDAKISVKAGDQAILEFGAQPSSKIEAENAEAPVQENNNLPLVILGGLFVALGIGLGVYVFFTRR